jgi:hypothetical protein
MRRGNLFWGGLILVLGLLFLLNTLNIIPASINIWAIFWPTLLIILGIWFLAGPAFSRRRIRETANISIPLEGAASAKVRLKHGAGKLNVTAGTESGVILSGDFSGGVEQAVSKEGDQIKVKLKTPNYVWPSGPSLYFEGLTWDIKLNREVPIRLDVDSGASSIDLDLTDLKVVEFNLDTGASSSTIILPAHAGETKVRVDSGAASVDIKIPDGVAARIESFVAVGGTHIDHSRFPNKGAYAISPDYDTATNRIDMVVKTGVGSANIH